MFSKLSNKTSFLLKLNKNNFRKEFNSFNKLKPFSYQRDFSSSVFKQPNYSLISFTPKNNKPTLVIVTKRYNHDDEHQKNPPFWDWEKILAVIGAILGIYISFLIWGWNFRFTALRDFDQKHNNEESEKKQKLIRAFLLENLPERPAGVTDVEYYELICSTVASNYMELKHKDPEAAAALYSAAFSIFVRFRDGRLLFETLKAFHKIGSPLKFVEKSLFASNSEQLFEDEIVGRYCHRVKLLVRAAFPILSVENFLTGNHIGSDEELLESVSWYSVKCKCTEEDIYTLVDKTDKTTKIGYLPSAVHMKQIYRHLEDKMPVIVAKHKEKKESKDSMIKKQRNTIKELEDKNTQLQVELHKSKDLYLYSSLKYMLANKEHREDIMKSNQKSNDDLKKKLTKISD